MVLIVPCMPNMLRSFLQSYPHPSPLCSLLRRLTYTDCIQWNVPNWRHWQRNKTDYSWVSLYQVTWCWQFPSTSTPQWSVSPTATVISPHDPEQFSPFIFSTSLPGYVLKLTPKNSLPVLMGKMGDHLIFEIIFIHVEVLIHSKF